MLSINQIPLNFTYTLLCFWPLSLSLWTPPCQEYSACPICLITPAHPERFSSGGTFCRKFSPLHIMSSAFPTNPTLCYNSGLVYNISDSRRASINWISCLIFVIRIITLAPGASHSGLVALAFMWQLVEMWGWDSYKGKERVHGITCGGFWLHRCWWRRQECGGWIKSWEKGYHQGKTEPTHSEWSPTLAEVQARTIPR
jgi:hypothetical protein